MVTESVFVFDSEKKNRLDAELFKLGIIGISIHHLSEIWLL